jgi:competence protein ComFC
VGYINKEVRMPVPLRPAYRIYRWLWSGLDWLYPPLCGGCGSKGERWCPSCQVATRVLGEDVCSICGGNLNASGLCRRCAVSRPHFDQLRSWAEYGGPLRHAIHRLKYSRDMSLGEALARPMVACFQSQAWPVDLILPVPLGLARLAQRGYNQATLLARPIALAMNLPFRPSGLERQRETRSQVDLSAEQRWTNVSGAFHADPGVVRGKRVLVVDDIATSCATLDACAIALREAGAEAVYCLTLARAGVKSHIKEPRHTNLVSSRG